MKKIRIGQEICLGDMALVPIEASEIFTYGNNENYYFHGNKKLLALLVCKSSEVTALDEEGNLIDVEKVYQQVDGLPEYVLNLQKQL